MALVQLHGLKSRPELNGKIAELLRAFPSKGRWELRVDGETLGVKPCCIDPCEDTCLAKLRQREVRLQGVANRPELNGATAKCGPFIADRERWQVTLADGETILLRSDSLLLVDTESTFKDPVVVVEHGGFGEAGSGMPQKALVTAERIPKGQVIFHEKPVIKAVKKDGWEEQCREYAKVFLAASPEKQTACLAMFAEPDLRMRKKGNSWERSGDMVEVLKKLGLYNESPKQNENVWKFMRVMQSNAFASEDGQFALFIWLCRANHSCSPNAVRNEHDGGKSLIAVRDLEDGEEITITYLSDIQLLEPCAARQQQLYFLGFECQCERCSSGVDDVRKFWCPRGCNPVDVVTTSQGEVGFSTCSKSKTNFDRVTTTEMLNREESFVEGVLQLDKNPFLLTYHPEYIEQLLSSAKGTYTPNHWAVARTHGLGVKQCRQEKAFGKALDHAKAELEFWDHHLRRPSQVTAWKRKLRGDIAAEKSDFMLALLEYSRALSEISYVLIAGPYFDELQKKLRLALEFQVDASPESTSTATNPQDLLSGKLGKFSPQDLLSGKLTPQDLLAGGLTPQDVLAAGGLASPANNGCPQQ